MFLSKKRKVIPSEAQAGNPSGVERIAQLIAQKSTRIQRKLSNKMQKKAERLSVISKKICLIIFSLIGIGISIYIITGNIFYKSTLPHFFLSRIPISKHVLENENRNSVTIPKSELNKIEDFKKYIDSLAKSTSGNKVKDSILKSRPLLMDSVNQLVELYQLGEKK